MGCPFIFPSPTNRPRLDNQGTLPAQPRQSQSRVVNRLETDAIRTLADGEENACQDADVHDVLRNADD